MNARDIEERCRRAEQIDLRKRYELQAEENERMVAEAKRRAVLRQQLEKEHEESIAMLIAERKYRVLRRLEHLEPNTVAHDIATWELKQLEAGFLPPKNRTKFEMQVDQMAGCLLGFEAE